MVEGKHVVGALLLVLLSECSGQQDFKQSVLDVARARGIVPDRILNSGYQRMPQGMDRYSIVYRSTSAFTCALYVFTDPVKKFRDVKQVSVNCN